VDKHLGLTIRVFLNWVSSVLKFHARPDDLMTSWFMNQSSNIQKGRIRNLCLGSSHLFSLAQWPKAFHHRQHQSHSPRHTILDQHATDTRSSPSQIQTGIMVRRDREYRFGSHPLGKLCRQLFFDEGDEQNFMNQSKASAQTVASTDCSHIRKGYWGTPSSLQISPLANHHSIERFRS